MKFFIFLAALFLSLPSLYSQVSSVTPEKPSIVDTIKVTYRPSESAAVLKNAETVFARVTVRLRDGDYSKFHICLVKGGDGFIGKFSLPLLAASFSVDFYTLNKEDENASRYRLVFDKAKGVPVEGAYLNAIFSDKADSLFALETRYYPDNYLAYANLFNIVCYIHGEQAGKEQIIRMLNKLQSRHKVNNEKLPGWYTALCLGNAKIGKLTEAKSDLFELMKHYPGGQEVAFAFSIYSYESYKAGNKELEFDLQNELKSVIIKYPKGPLANIGYAYLAGDESVSISTFEEIFRHKVSIGHLEYSELASLPELYIMRQIKLDTAETMLWEAIGTFQSGSVNHEYLLKNHHYQEYVPQMYYDLGRIAALRGQWQKVITLTSAGNNLVSGSNVEGNLRPKLVGLRANAYKRIGNVNQALLDYETVYKMGETSCLDSMREIFPAADVKSEKFEQFLSSMKTKTPLENYGYSDPAPGLSATDLAGNSIKLADFKGKIVVLNAWGIGCGPCVAEMPDLNQLVNQNKSDSNIVFLGVAVDETESLIKFLKIHKYEYRVLNKAHQLLETLNIGSLPTHIVIGKNGQILSRSEGGKDDIRSYLQRVIDSDL